MLQNDGFLNCMHVLKILQVHMYQLQYTCISACAFISYRSGFVFGGLFFEFSNAAFIQQNSPESEKKTPGEKTTFSFIFICLFEISGCCRDISWSIYLINIKM